MLDGTFDWAIRSASWSAKERGVGAGPTPVIG